GKQLGLVSDRLPDKRIKTGGQPPASERVQISAQPPGRLRGRLEVAQLDEPCGLLARSDPEQAAALGQEADQALPALAEGRGHLAEAGLGAGLAVTVGLPAVLPEPALQLGPPGDAGRVAAAVQLSAPDQVAELAQLGR